MKPGRHSGIIIGPGLENLGAALPFEICRLKPDMPQSCPHLTHGLAHKFQKLIGVI